MRALFYLKIRTIINSIKQLKEKPSKLISALFYLGFLTFIFVVPSSNTQRNPLETIAGVEDFSLLVFSAILFLIMIFVNTIAWHTGTKRGVSIFTFPDTQFLFTAPLKPATILLYGMLSQVRTSLISTAFLLYQIPNLKRLNLSGNQIVGVFAIWFLLVFSNHIFTAFIYAISFQSEKRKTLVLSVVYGLITLTVVLFAFFAIREGSFFNGFLKFIETKLLYLIPGAGWAKGILDGLLFGFGWLNIVCFAAFLIAPIILLRLIYKIDFDYFEDALSMIQIAPGTDQQAEANQAALTKYFNRVKIRKTGLNHGYGESAIFYKQLREHRRSRPHLIGLSMLVLLLILGAMAVSTTGSPTMKNPLIFWGASAFMLFFFSFNSTTFRALNEHQFFTLPGKSSLKIIYASLLGILLAMQDLVPAYLFVIIYQKFNLLLLIVGLLLSGSLFMVFNTSQIIVFRIFGEIKSAFSTMVMITLSLVCSIPGIALIVIGGLGAFSNPAVWSYLLIAVGFMVNCLIGLLGVAVGKRYLEEGPIR